MCVYRDLLLCVHMETRGGDSLFYIILPYSLEIGLLTDPRAWLVLTSLSGPPVSAPIALGL